MYFLFRSLVFPFVGQASVLAHTVFMRLLYDSREQECGTRRSCESNRSLLCGSSARICDRAPFAAESTLSRWPLCGPFSQLLLSRSKVAQASLTPSVRRRRIRR